MAKPKQATVALTWLLVKNSAKAKAGPQPADRRRKPVAAGIVNPGEFATED